ncbi:acyl-coenzyme A synthetase ACSM3, mitochondrial-like isoform X2 [Tachypleus tridentatus]|uniref:acyl-coenzyme A synthetase ACSM3, mitochondrial-like isoform X2 n=1 Tax=Tachypleus tridentatus TaxID=6853 RepID=UPI003FD6B3AB
MFKATSKPNSSSCKHRLVKASILESKYEARGPLAVSTLSLFRSQDFISREMFILNGSVRALNWAYRSHNVKLPNLRNILCICSRTFSDEAWKRSQPFVPKYFNFVGDVIDQWTSKEQDGLKVGKGAFWFVQADGTEVVWSFKELSDLAKNQRFRKTLFSKDWRENYCCVTEGTGMVDDQLSRNASRFSMFQPSAVFADHQVASSIDQIADQCPSLKTKVLVGKDEKYRNGWLSFQSLLKKASSSHQCVRSRSEDVFCVFFTSGTTGQPKMVEHTHASYGIGHSYTVKAFDLKESDVFWNIADTGWAKTAWSSMFTPWIAGCCSFVHEMPKFDASLVLQTLHKYPISTFCAPPTVYRLITQDLQHYSFPHLRNCLSGGEPLNPEVISVWKKKTNVSIREIYGQTETTILCSMLSCILAKPGSFGKPVPGIPVTIIDDEGKETPPGVEGHIVLKVKPCRPIGLFKGYTNNPDQTASVFKGDYFYTGDRGYKDKDGYFWFVGRSDDIIISSGYRIGPFEVESALLEHFAVMEAAVVSSPDPERGEVVKAFVVLKEKYRDTDHDILIRELQTHVKSHTAPYKYPRKIVFVEELPKTSSGKIKRKELRLKEWQKIKV